MIARLAGPLLFTEKGSFVLSVLRKERRENHPQTFHLSQNLPAASHAHCSCPRSTHPIPEYPEWSRIDPPSLILEDASVTREPRPPFSVLSQDPADWPQSCWPGFGAHLTDKSVETNWAVTSWDTFIPNL